MIAFKGRLSFRQYMPAKPTKYGIKVWLTADSSNGFVLNHKVYLGKERNAALHHGLGYDVVTDICLPFLGKFHKIYFDNFFSSTKPLKEHKREKTYAYATVHLNRKGLPPCAKCKLAKGEQVSMEKGNIVFTKWYDK